MNCPNLYGQYKLGQFIRAELSFGGVRGETSAAMVFYWF